MNKLALPIYKEPNNLEKAALIINQLGKNIHQHAYLVGKILFWVKRKLKHGEFISWIERNIWFSIGTAERYIKFAKKCDEKGFLLEYAPKFLIEEIRHRDEFKLPPGKFQIILADPPWQFQNVGFEESAQKHYPTMSVEEISALKIPAEDNAVLFLWVVNTHIAEGLEVCKNWGFEFKTEIVWCKNKGPSIGWWIKSRHELLFIAQKGEGIFPQERINSWFQAEATKHSKKPEIVYEIIEKMYPNQRYLELFARQPRKGWTSWGNEL